MSSIEGRDIASGMDGGRPSSASAEPATETQRGLVGALRNAGVSVLYQDLDLRLVWARNVPATFAGANRPGAADADFLPAAVAERVVAKKRSVLGGEKAERMEISVPDPDGARWFQIWIDADRGSDGATQGIVTTLVEITETKRREETLTTLLREVSHRSKNLLAIIQSIATQTGRHATTVDAFLARFRGRLQSLAWSQDLVTSSNWRGADLYELVFGQVARYTVSPHGAVRFEGDRIWLNPNAALHIGLALHELAVNSVSFGALSKPDGVVTVSASVVPGPPGESALALTWSEPVAAPDTDPALRNKRFGSTALERIVPASLNGVASLDIGADKVEYRLAVPIGSFEGQ